MKWSIKMFVKVKLILPLFLIAISFIVIRLAIIKSSPESSDEKLGILLNPDKILAADQRTISEEQFYKYESAIIFGNSGSGGYFLGEPEIAWIIKMENFFKSKGVALKDNRERHNIIAWSYFSGEKYDKALEEFKNIEEQSSVELVEWVLANKGIKSGLVKIKEYPGKIPDEATETARAEDGHYLFASYFKGPMYRYNKLKDVHAIVYSPESQYNWCEDLAFDGKNLVMTLRDDAGIVTFNNASGTILHSELKEN